MERTKVLAIVLGVAILGYAAHDLATINRKQNELSDMANEQTIAMCEDVRQQVCLQGRITESDYPDGCFEDGQHILDEPYTCPG